MGKYINIGNSNFIEALNGGFVDKSELIERINETLFTLDNMTCVTRCRRFGKTTAADMLCAYYDKSCDSRSLFRGLAIEHTPSFETHLNKYRVIFVNMASLIAKCRHNPNNVVDLLERELIEDLLEAYPDVKMHPTDDLMDLLLTIAIEKGEIFFMIIDEWDAINREFKDDRVVNQYTDLLIRLFKNQNTARVFAGAYITGIFPIKKHDPQSVLNFSQSTMIIPGRLAPYYGFTKVETIALCEKYDKDYVEMEKWYGGYQIGGEKSMLNPNSVMAAIAYETYGNFRTPTRAFDLVSHCIEMNLEGLKDDIIKMLAGGRASVQCSWFNNDLKSINNKDDVLTALVHLGYLSYNPIQRECFIPNLEVRQDIERAILRTNWHEVIDAIESSETMLEAAIYGDQESVASGVEMVHTRVVNIQKTNTEESLSHVITLAFYKATTDYVIQREMPAGKGFAGLIFTPRKNVDSPALVIELKYEKNVKTAIDQIRERKYPEALRGFTNNIVLVAINYDPTTKQHSCRIEKT